MSFRPTELKTLLESRLLSRLGSDGVAAIAAVSRRTELERHATLYTETTRGDSLAVVVAGRLDVRLRTLEGPQSLWPLWPSDATGILECIDPSIRVSSTTAIQDSVVLELSRQSLSRLWSRQPRVGGRLLNGINIALADRLRDANRRIESSLVHLASDSRYADEASEVMGSSRPHSRPMEQRVAPGAFRGRVDARHLAATSGLGPEDLASLSRIGRPATYQPGQPLFEEGDPADGCVLLLDGVVEVVKAAGQASRVVAELSAGSLVGQVGAVDAGPRSASVRAKDVVAALVLDAATYRALVSHEAPLGMRLSRATAVATARQLRLAIERLGGLLASRAASARAQLLPGARVDPRPERQAPGTKQPGAGGIARGDVADILADVKVVRVEGEMNSAQLRTRLKSR